MNQESFETPKMNSGDWNHPVLVAKANFVLKSLCDWSVNTTVGCGHGCRFCYVPSTATNKQEPALNALGVKNPDAEWGRYVFVRTWDEEQFLASLRAAENTLEHKLKPEGNRAVMFCSTTDPYQVIKNVDSAKQKELNERHRKMVRRSLELIRDNSTLNVRILTRSPLANADFDLMTSFGPRLLFGMSLPTLNDKLARIYEPWAPAPSKRLETLKAAKAKGLHVYVAVAPTYPECDEADLRATLTAVAELDPVTVFHEPINIRAENVERIRLHGEMQGVNVEVSVFANDDSLNTYRVRQLKQVEKIAGEVGLERCLHLWPDKDLAATEALQALDDPTAHLHWLASWWTRVSKWPTQDAPTPAPRTPGSDGSGRQSLDS